MDFVSAIADFFFRVMGYYRFGIFPGQGIFSVWVFSGMGYFEMGCFGVIRPKIPTLQKPTPQKDNAPKAQSLKKPTLQNANAPKGQR